MSAVGIACGGHCPGFDGHAALGAILRGQNASYVLVMLNQLW